MTRSPGSLYGGDIPHGGVLVVAVFAPGTAVVVVVVLLSGTRLLCGY